MESLANQVARFARAREEGNVRYYGEEATRRQKDSYEVDDNSLSPFVWMVIIIGVILPFIGAVAWVIYTLNFRPPMCPDIDSLCEPATGPMVN